MKGKWRVAALPLLLLLAAEPLSAETRRVVVISVDGLRADAVSEKFTPNIARIQREGMTAPNAVCEMPSQTVPNHASMVTGLKPSTHGLISNDGSQPLKKPSLFQLLRQAGRNSGFYVSKRKLSKLVKPSEVGRYCVDRIGSSALIVDSFVADIASPETRWDFSFIHITEPDHAGHDRGWMTQAYVNAVFQADREVGRILTALENDGLLEETLLILTSDHGGKGTAHKADIPENRKIPWLIRGPGIQPGSRLERPVGPIDIAPTVLAAFGLPVPESMEGSPVVVSLVRLNSDLSGELAVSN